MWNNGTEEYFKIHQRRFSQKANKILLYISRINGVNTVEQLEMEHWAD